MSTFRWSEAQADALVEAAFMTLLGRHPDTEGRRFYVDHLVHGRLSVEQFLAQLTASAEFADKALRWTSTPDHDRAIEAALAQASVRELSLRLASHAVAPTEAFDRALASRNLPFDRVPGQADYATGHQRRFHELFLAVRTLTESTAAPRILEFGPSLFSTLYESFCPGCRLVFVDRPTRSRDESFEPILRPLMSSPIEFVEVDLLGDLDAAAPLLDRFGRFDLVVFTEVLEHLARHPAEVLAFLLHRLAPAGVLYLTTPNALGRSKLRAIRRGRNPQQMYPRRGDNIDAHHHVREYSMVELIEAVREAGGQLRALYFSMCWDDPQELDSLRERPAESGNLVLVAGHAPSN
jgi:SAM-dependent methyltransferase